MGFINSLFSEWGIVINPTKTYSSKIINKKKINICSYKYTINFMNEINKYI